MMDDYRKILLTGDVYIKYYDESLEIKKGDIRLFLHDDAISTFQGDYDNTSYSGYFKGEVFDGKHWHLISLDEFLSGREYKFAKKQRPIDTAIFCKNLLTEATKGIEIYRTYRGHFTREEYIPEVRITKANRSRK